MAREFVGGVLLEAADLIEAKGHWRGSGGRPAGELCAYTAIIATEAPIQDKRLALDYLYVVLGEAGWRGIGAWNDAHSKVYVVAKLREFARPLASIDRSGS